MPTIHFTALLNNNAVELPLNLHPIIHRNCRRRTRIVMDIQQGTESALGRRLSVSRSPDPVDRRAE
ncbi:hypothetical protein WJ542_01925 [Paraburkholderia sp. B3]|uniref:hypothetical protein n=1 Tax=Paraburkholderia sp. B3 TaxID=3134791 RepID=UPI003981E46A